jgi:branched-chain amino acid transport system ATP-binding protein
MSAAFSVSDLHVHYGVIEAVKGIDMTLDRGEITALLGANGAGKSTVLLAISGLVKSTSGLILFEGIELNRLAPHQIVTHGVVHVPEGREILTTLTVRENLLLGAYRRQRKDEIALDLEKVLAMFPRLRERLDGAAGNLSGGEQQMLAIARALMARPRLLLLDEPSMGLAPLVVQEIFNILRTLNRGGLTILLVEQNARLALSIAQRGYVMENGRVVLFGSSAELLSDRKIIDAYLGA